VVAVVVVAFFSIVCVFFSCIVVAVDVCACVVATVDFVVTGRAAFVIITVFVVAFRVNAGVIVHRCDIRGCILVIGASATLRSGKLVMEFMKLGVRVRKLVAEIRKLGVRPRLFVVGVVSGDSGLAAFWEGRQLGANGFLGCACRRG